MCDAEAGMKRREWLIAAGAVVTALTVPVPLQVIRAAVDCDLSVTALLEAIGQVGEGPYTLRVPPENLGYARATLSRAFLKPERYADFTISVERLDGHVDSWALDNGRRQFYTTGA